MKVPAKVADRGLGDHPGGAEEPDRDVGAAARTGSGRPGEAGSSAPATSSRCRGRRYPSHGRVRVAVRLTTLDGRAFEADKDVTVKLCRHAASRSAPAGRPFDADSRSDAADAASATAAASPDPLPPGVEELPPPAPRRAKRRRDELVAAGAR